jgi:hypothetical protein
MDNNMEWSRCTSWSIPLRGHDRQLERRVRNVFSSLSPFFNGNKTVKSAAFILFLGVTVMTSERAKADFPALETKVVIPGCQIARLMDGTDAALIAASRTFSKDPRIAMSTAYCAAWAAEAFDRYADKPGCFTNDMSVDDLILIVINDAAQHPEWGKFPFIASAGSAILDRWPDCVRRDKEG